MKHCIDCKHSQPRSFAHGRSFTVRDCTRYPFEDMVTGEKRITSCWDVRERQDLCGVEAKWFEAKNADNHEKTYSIPADEFIKTFHNREGSKS